MVPVRYNFRSVLERRATSLMTMLGVALVSMIFVLLFGFMAGLNQSLMNAGQDRNWIVLARGVTSENESYIPHEATAVISSRPEIAVDGDKHPLLSRESLAGVNISRSKGAKEFALLRGVDPIAFQVHPNLRVVEGHWPTRGNNEWVVGQRLLSRYPYLHPGASFHYLHHDWKIVGVFSDHDSARESEIMTDQEDLRNERHWEAGGGAALHLVLNPGTSAEFAQAVKGDRRFTLDSESETDYYAAQAKVAGQLRGLGLIVAVALAIGATFGGMNTMYTAVTRRGREIGVLRVLGFSDAETETATESDSLANVVTAIGSIKAIIYSLCLVVMLTVLLIAANSMAMMVRDRISEVAVMRALGFTRTHIGILLFSEAALLGLSGAAIGASLALWYFGAGIKLGEVTGMLGYMQVRPETALAAIAAALTVSIASAVVPVMNAMRVVPAMAFQQVV